LDCRGKGGVKKRREILLLDYDEEKLNHLAHGKGTVEEQRSPNVGHAGAKNGVQQVPITEAGEGDTPSINRKEGNITRQQRSAQCAKIRGYVNVRHQAKRVGWVLLMMMGKKNAKTLELTKKIEETLVAWFWTMM